MVKTSKSGRVDFGSQVTLDTGDGEVEYEMVSGYESDPVQKKLSVYSPIGKAILGKKSGDSVEIEVPVGVKTFKIVKIE